MGKAKNIVVGLEVIDIHIANRQRPAHRLLNGTLNRGVARQSGQWVIVKNPLDPGQRQTDPTEQLPEVNRLGDKIIQGEISPGLLLITNRKDADNRDWAEETIAAQGHQHLATAGAGG